jgi:GT2 family glycosyltransferase
LQLHDFEVEAHKIRSSKEVTHSRLSILIATKGRIDELERLLEGIRTCAGRDLIDHEVLIANNAPDGECARAVENLVRLYSKREPHRWFHVREPIPGKSGALNKLIPISRGDILAFLDDDVEVTSSWLQATYEFFTGSDFDVMQGSIQIPPAFAADKSFLKLLNRYRTICYYQRPSSEVREIRSLNAANMALRRSTLKKTGLFDERIGPGQSGTSMDVEFGKRLIRAGWRIGYEPSSIVYHNVDWSRLTESYFRYRHEMQGRSRLIYKGSSLPKILADLLHAVVTLGIFRLLSLFNLMNNERKTYRAKGRYFHYRAMLWEKIRGLCRFMTPRMGVGLPSRPRHRPQLP